MLLPPTGRAAEDADPNRFILMADVHVCADRDAREHDCNPDEMIQQAVRDILELTPRPSAVIVAGDCAYLHGKKGDYEALREFLAPLRAAGLPLLMAMGNHDNREEFASVFPEAAILHGAELKSRRAAVLESPMADWYLLDSCKMTGYTGGEFGGEQLEWLGGRLNSAPQKPALIVAHHYPKGTEKDNGLEDTEAFYSVVGPRKQVKCYFFGHSHAWSLKEREDGLRLVNLPANAWQFNGAQPRGFVDAQLRKKGCTLTLHCLDRTDKRHGEKHELDWRKA